MNRPLQSTPPPSQYTFAFDPATTEALGKIFFFESLQLPYH